MLKHPKRTLNPFFGPCMECLPIHIWFLFIVNVGKYSSPMEFSVNVWLIDLPTTSNLPTSKKTNVGKYTGRPILSIRHWPSLVKFQTKRFLRVVWFGVRCSHTVLKVPALIMVKPCGLCASSKRSRTSLGASGRKARASTIWGRTAPKPLLKFAGHLVGNIGDRL